MQFPYITTHYLDLVPIVDNTYAIDSEDFNISSELISMVIDGQTYENAFAIVVKNEPHTSSICAICTLLHKDQAYVNFKVVDRGYIKNLEYDFVTADKYRYTYIPDDISVTIQRLFSRLSVVYRNIKFKSLDSTLENLNKVAVKVITDNTDLLSYYEATDIRTLFFIFYEYYCLLLEIKSSSLFQEGLTEYQENTFPDYVKDKISSEQKVLSKHTNSNQESVKIEEYLDLVKAIPWGIFGKSDKDILTIEKELNSSHYGLSTVKDKVLDSIAFELYTSKNSSDYLLFSGPPGTGKTSIAKSIAKILNREYVYISMAGMNDESELRGHRRTYIGSKPGRIVEKLSKIKTMNPVIVLDEIDKITTSRTNPEYALLELLDPEQNFEFFDRYLELPLDLSKCIFICTSNNHKKLPPPLLDRLQLIEFFPYSTEEKYTILTQYMLPSIIRSYDVLDLLKLDNDLLSYLSKNHTLRDIKANIFSIVKRNSKLVANSKTLITSLSNYHSNFNTTKKEKNIGFK